MVQRRIIIGLLVAGGVLVAVAMNQAPPASKAQGLLIPHHLLVEDRIEAVYREYGGSGVKQVLILGPNHFGAGMNWIQSDTPEMDFFEPSTFKREHAVTVHRPYIARFFPKAKEEAVVLKEGTPEFRLEALVDRLALRFNPQNTVVVASIDFTHQEPESVAQTNDARTQAFIAAALDPTQPVPPLSDLVELAKSPNGVALDSPEALYVWIHLMRRWNADPYVDLGRTSSIALLGDGVKQEDNTSHLYGIASRAAAN